MSAPKYSNCDLAQVFCRKAGVFQTETKKHKNRSSRKASKQELAKHWK